MNHDLKGCNSSRRMGEQVTAVKELERKQVELINEFLANAESETTLEGLAGLVYKATSDSALITFSKFLSLPTFTKLSDTSYALSLDLLRLFAYGTWHDYTSNNCTFPKLAPMQIQKLKQLTLMILAQATKVLTYDQLKKELDFSHLTDLECFLNKCTNSGIIAGKLNQKLQHFEVIYTVDTGLKFYDEVAAGQSFDTFLQEATAARKDDLGLWSNDIVRQVELPTENAQRCYKSEFQIKGSRLFSMLVQHATNAHVTGKSFDGHIYTGMFTVSGDQLFLRPAAVARKKLTSASSSKDHNAVGAILKRYTGLDVLHKDRHGTVQKVLYPLYMNDLLDHLEGRIVNLHPIHVSCPINKARDANFITFLVCHATFLTPAERSLLFWYVRTYHKGSSPPDQANFRSAMGRILCKIKWYADLRNHWLFKKVFQSGLVTYRDNEVDCFRLIRDWEIHVPKHLTDLQKIKYTAAVLNYLVEHHFGDFLPQAMYQMLCSYSMMDNKFDLRDWIERLRRVSKDDIILLKMEWDRLSRLLPASISSSDNQIDIFRRDMKKLRQNAADTETSDDCCLAKWRLLNRLHKKNETAYYKVLIENIEEYAPIVYRPTISLVCQLSSGTLRKPWGMYFSAEDQGKMISMVNDFPADEIDIIVVTDGSMAMGSDDLGVKGIGVAAGKIDLYVAAAGINPQRILPVMVDVGTDSTELLKDSLYYGIQDHRLDGDNYLAVLDEFMLAVFTRWPRVIVEFEDFKTKWAYPLLERYRKTYRIFNDDIQGTAAVTVAGLLGAMRAQGRPVSDLQKQRIVIASFGRAGVGVLNSASRLLVKIMRNSEDSLTENDAVRSQTWIVDADGLVTEERTDMDSEVRLLSRKSTELISHDLQEGASLVEVIKKVKPDALLGLSAVDGGGRFSNKVLEALKDSSSSRPAIFAMSNPSECTATDVFSILGENITFASGSTFSDVDLGNGKLGHSYNGNTMYLFPGIVLGTLLSGAPLISDRMLQAAVICFALNIKEEEVLQGIIYPPISRIREITKLVAAAVVAEARSEGLAEGYRLTQLAKLRPEGIADFVEENMWSPD